MDQQKEEEVKVIKGTDFIDLIKRLVDFLIAFKWPFLIVIIIGGVAGFMYANTQKPTYESRLTFALDDNSGGGISGALSLASQFGLDLGGSKDIFTGDNISFILKSRRIVERVLLSVDTVDGKPMTMATEFMNINEYNKGLLKMPRLADVKFPIGQKRETYSYIQDTVLFIIYNAIAENNLVSQKPDKKLNIYELKFISENERYSKIFIEKLIIEATAFYTELRTKHSKETLDILEKRVAMLKGSVNTAISSRASTQDANINAAFAAAQAPIQKQQLDISVYGAAYGELYKNLELARYQYLKNIPLLQIVDAPQYPMKKIRVGRVKTGVKVGFILFFTLFSILLVWRLFFKRKEQKVLVIS